MLNIHELETQWLRYKIKSFIPHVIIFFSLIIIIAILVFVDFSSPNQSGKMKKLETPKIIQNTKPILKELNISTPLLAQKDLIKIKTLPAKKEIPISKSTQIPLQKKEKLLLLPSLEFIQNINRNSPSYYSNEDVKHNTVTPKTNVTKAKAVEVQAIKIEEVPKAIAVINSTAIKIKRQNTQEDIQHVVKRFKKSNNPALSLFIAKKYYELENYSQAYNYALMTNGINNQIEESWIIFAKSLYKLGKKGKAIEILSKYISTSHSSRAKLLLDTIKSGKLK